MTIYPNDGAYPFGEMDTHGLSKREYFAAMAMQGFCSHYGTRILDQDFDVEASRCAVKIANELIKSLNKTQ